MRGHMPRSDSNKFLRFLVSISDGLFKVNSVKMLCSRPLLSGLADPLIFLVFLRLGDLGTFSLRSIWMVSA